jgi:flagellar biosynthesis protein FlhB
MAQARIYPPSEQRIAEARRAGHVPRSSFVAFASLLAVTSCALDGWGDLSLQRLAALWQGLLEACARGEAQDAGQVLLDWVARGAWLLMALLLALFLTAVGTSLWAQGSARRLPLQRLRRGFERANPPRTSKVLWSVLVSLLALAALYESMRVAPNTVGPTFSDWLMRLSALTALVAVLDVALARADFMRSLWLTRREHLDDQRDAYGPPELRAERARLRRESASVGPSERP